MKTSEKIGLIIVAASAIILVGTIIANKGDNKKETRDSFCNRMCHQVGAENWIFPGAEPNSNFSTKDECISACLNLK